ncbi:MAG: sigma 54-interacting transcriptional regulator [Proteobacteria bacterium]|nr:sigma 54-interacting transcriptional regulator [Pseudomonadota bacterium]
MKAKILVIDDEENLRFTFERFLKAKGYEVAEAKDYDEAVEHLKDSPFDIIFSDILLGGKTGIDLLRYVKEKGILAPVIMITGAPDIETASEAVRLGAFDYISKPVFQDTLLRVAKIALQQAILIQEKNRYRSNLEAIFRSVEDGIVSVDNEMNIVEVNHAIKNICKYSREETAGKNFHSIHLPCNKKCQSVLMQTIETQKAVEMYRLECQNSEKADQVVTLRTSPLIDEMGNFSGAILIVRDETHVVQLEKDLEERQQFHRIIGKSEKMLKLYSLIEDLTEVDTTVLIMGESGTGKELVAEALHHGGGRSKKPFIKVNCSALPENLLESELFGHVKGAFTGAVKDKAGRFEKANGGSIFLDEIGDISPRMQLRLLRVLQEREFERVGDSTPVKVDVRIIAATNQDLRARVREGVFREDLYYRLKVVQLNIPPLRERREDIPLLLDHFIKKFNHKFGKHVTGLSDDAMKPFFNYPWPGNIREMEHSMEHAFILCHGNMITVEEVTPEIIDFAKSSAPSEEMGEGDEHQRIIEALKKSAWNKAKAARILGIGRATMYRKMEKYNIDPDSPQ